MPKGVNPLPQFLNIKNHLNLFNIFISYDLIIVGLELISYNVRIFATLIQNIYIKNRHTK